MLIDREDWGCRSGYLSLLWHPNVYIFPFPPHLNIITIYITSQSTHPNTLQRISPDSLVAEVVNSSLIKLITPRQEITGDDNCSKLEFYRTAGPGSDGLQSLTCWYFYKLRFIPDRCRYNKKKPVTQWEWTIVKNFESYLETLNLVWSIIK